jgi:hypothetical protein
MGIELPSAGVLPSDKMFGTEGAPNPMMQQAFAGLSGMQMGGQPARRKTWVDRVFPLLNLLAVVGLVTSAVFWWNPLTNYWRQLQGSGPVDANVKVDLKAEWEALYPSGSTPSVRQALGPAPVFWMFVTIELALQATRWMFNWVRLYPFSPEENKTLFFRPELILFIYVYLGFCTTAWLARYSHLVTAPTILYYRLNR